MVAPVSLVNDGLMIFLQDYSWVDRRVQSPLIKLLDYLNLPLLTVRTIRGLWLALPVTCLFILFFFSSRFGASTTDLSWLSSKITERETPGCDSRSLGESDHPQLPHQARV